MWLKRKSIMAATDRRVSLVGTRLNEKEVNELLGNRERLNGP